MGEAKKRRLWVWTCSFLVLAGAFIGGLLAFVVLIPREKVSISDANLILFELTVSPTTLFYNLRFTMKIHRYFKYEYNDMEIDCYYNTKKFDSTTLGDLELRKTTLLNLSSIGNSTIDLGSNGVDAFKRSNETGFFDLEIRLKGKRFTHDDDGDHVEKLSHRCKLRLQLVNSQNSTTQDNFKPVKCH